MFSAHRCLQAEERTCGRTFTAAVLRASINGLDSVALCVSARPVGHKPERLKFGMGPEDDIVNQRGNKSSASTPLGTQGERNPSQGGDREVACIYGMPIGTTESMHAAIFVALKISFRASSDPRQAPTL